MKTSYVDASVLLRWIFQQPSSLNLEALGPSVIASTLLRTECWRSLDRRYRITPMSREERTLRETALTMLFRGIQEYGISRTILARAAGSMPSPLGTLDAIHLATALMWRERGGGELEFATHDRELARAAQLYGFAVIGV